MLDWKTLRHRRTRRLNPTLLTSEDGRSRRRSSVLVAQVCCPILPWCRRVKQLLRHKENERRHLISLSGVSGVCSSIDCSLHISRTRPFSALGSLNAPRVALRTCFARMLRFAYDVCCLTCLRQSHTSLSGLEVFIVQGLFYKAPSTSPLVTSLVSPLHSSRSTLVSLLSL